MSRINTEGQVVSLKPNPRFKNYSEVFKNLLKQNNCPTMYPICSMIITYDSSKVIAVTKKDDSEQYIRQYDLETYEMTFSEKFGGKDEDYIKMKEVEQSSDGKNYAIIYNNDGHFFLRTFGKAPVNGEGNERSEEEIKANELDINKLLGINNYTMCNQTFPDPFCTCTFLSNTLIYIDLFANAELKHIHFIYDIAAKKMVGQQVEKILNCTEKNFPYKCFFNEEK